VAEFADALRATDLVPRAARENMTATAVPEETLPPETLREGSAWLAGVAVRFPGTLQPAAVLDEALGRPAGWLERHAGIQARRVWASEDPLAAAVDVARASLASSRLLPGDVGALLVTSEAPPLLAGLAAALHHRLDLRPATVALETGGACTGFLAALWLAQALLARTGPVLLVSIEAPSRFLLLEPGPAGEAAALFGDGVAAALVCPEPTGGPDGPLLEIILGNEGGAGGLLRVERRADGCPELHLDGRALAGHAVRAMAGAVRDLARAHGLAVTDLEGIVAHGGNGRMPALLARQLGLPPERVWSETATLGNLGSASLPAAWASRASHPQGPVAWTAAGAGLTWGAALTGILPGRVARANSTA
jgi:3-oxoacyl-[acyl-carrier-protein] synthase-3